MEKIVPTLFFFLMRQVCSAREHSVAVKNYSQSGRFDYGASRIVSSADPTWRKLNGINIAR